MSEYQRYEFMTCDRPLTKAQQVAVHGLSSHIEASATHALIEYHWGDFKHDPIKVLGDFFDGFLYWANWGSPQLAFRFPHGILPATLLDGYDLDDFVTLTQTAEYDILDIHINELEGPDEWTDYELGSLIALRDELMAGDLRGLYIVWLAAQRAMGTYDEAEEYDITAPPVPSGLNTRSAAQQALAELLQLPPELLGAAARHSSAARPAPKEDVAAWVKLLTDAQRDDYLERLARGEPGLSQLFMRELRKLGQAPTTAPSATESVTYATLLAESQAVKAQLEREQREQARLDQQRHLQEIHDRQDDYWLQLNQAMTRSSGAAYDEATDILVELRQAAKRFNDSAAFHERFRAWIQPHLRRPAFIKRLQAQKFSLSDE